MIIRLQNLELLVRDGAFQYFQQRVTQTSFPFNDLAMRLTEPEAHSLSVNFSAEIEPLIGSTISHAWKGYGSAIFLELGTLAPPESSRLNHQAGEWCIAIEWDWRLESSTGILFGSSNSGTEISSRIVELEGCTIESITTFGDVPELLVSLSTGNRIRTTAMLAGDPQWSIKLSETEWLYVAAGALQIGDGRAELTDEENRTIDYEERTVKRWGTPMNEPANGNCYQCSSFVRLDGHLWLLDYGVCAAPNSLMDGKVIKRDSGCPQFTLRSGS